MLTYEIDSCPAAILRQGDRVLPPSGAPRTLASRPLYLRGRKADPAQQWVTLRFTDGSEIEAHQGDYFDKIIAEVTA